MKVPAFYSLVLDDAAAAAKVWLPFLKPGGLLVTTRREHALGEEVVVLVQLPDGAKHSVSGRVAWISADSLSTRRQSTAGIALVGEEGVVALAEITKTLACEIAPEDSLLAQCQRQPE